MKKWKFPPALIEAITAGDAVMANIGFTPQSEHQIGVVREQGVAEETKAKPLVERRTMTPSGRILHRAGVVPGDVAKQITDEVPIPDH